MEDPENGMLIVEKEKLKEASSKYVSKLLTNRDPKCDYKREFEIMESLHTIRMEENKTCEELTLNDFEELLKDLSKKDKKKYQFILRAGKSYQDLLFTLYSKIWDSETKPSSWKKTV